jgi:ATP-dependent helicase/DNAse subunit B
MPRMLLFIGPPGSGKTHAVLEQVREELKNGRASFFRLLAPTATMAEHLRNLLAREGFVFRASLISTLSRFVEPVVKDLTSVSSAALDLLIADSLDRLAPAEFRAVSALPGFRAALARSIEELSAAGCNAQRLTSSALQRVYAEVEKDAAARGMALSGERLKCAAAQISEQGLPGIERIFFDGFFSFADPELEVIDALRSHADVTITLPQRDGAEESRERLTAFGFRERRFEPARAKPEIVLLAAQTQDQELEEIAARVLEQVSAGRLFREIGIVVRAHDAYVPALRATLERFGIPARFYFAEPLADHSVVRRFASALETGLGGGDAGRTPAEWALRVKSLRTSFSPPRPVDPATHEMVAVWRGAAAALDAFDEVVDETASAFPQDSLVSYAVFWRHLRSALRLTPLRVPDHRRNVVHVMDAHEARQWELPVVFVCGLLEKQTSQDPILSDRVRHLLRASGIRVAGAAERDEEDRFLFEVAVTRSTGTLVLSYPRFNQKGEETLRSFHLDRFLETAGPLLEAPARSARPEPRSSRPTQRRAMIFDEALRQRLAELHASSSPTALEVFLQCPFQFFAQRTLRLEGPPLEPEERLDARVQGEIVHEVLARWLRTRQPVEVLFADVFREACAREKIPEGYRAEAVRLELLRNLRAFIGGVLIPGASPADAELRLTLPLGSGTTLTCRIDRIDLMPDGRALIIDYKYRSPKRIRDLVEGHDAGTHIQGGIYIRAVENTGRKVAGMQFAGIRGEVKWDGWTDAAQLHEVMDKSVGTAQNAVFQILEGVIVPNPADPDLCQYCDFLDICRVETVAKVAVSGKAGEWI